MSFENNLSLDFLKKDNENLSKNGQDSSEGIVPSKEFEEVSVNQNGDGTWSKSSVEKKSPVKKDNTARSDEAKQYSEEVGALETYAKVSDNKIISIATQINQKKQLIFTKIAEAVAAGCSVGIGTSGVDAIVNGVTIGVGVTITDDYPFIKKYGGLDDPTAKVPFNSDDTVTLTTSNSGKGYFSGFTENGGEPIIVDAPLDGNVGIYRTVFNNPLFPPSPIGICTDRTEEIIILANEINVLRSQIDSDLITKTNTIKDRKTTSEVFVWGYASREHKVQDQIDINNTVINTINTPTAAISPTTIIQDQSLKLYYDARSGGASSNLWLDISGNGNHGTITNANYVSTSPQFFNFNGEDTSVATYGGIDLYNSSAGTEISVEAWVNPDKFISDDGDTSQRIVNGGGITKNYDLSLMRDGGDLQGKVKARIGNSVTKVALSNTIVNDRWYHLVMTYTSQRYVRIYVDASEEGIYDWGSGLGPTIFRNGFLENGVVQLGQYDGINSNNLNGQIGETRIYNRALTPTEITQNYNATKARYE